MSDTELEVWGRRKGKKRKGKAVFIIFNYVQWYYIY